MNKLIILNYTKNKTTLDYVYDLDDQCWRYTFVNGENVRSLAYHQYDGIEVSIDIDYHIDYDAPAYNLQRIHNYYLQWKPYYTKPVKKLVFRSY